MAKKWESARSASVGQDGSGFPLPETPWRAVAQSLRLTPRETELARAVMGGCRDPKIALDLGLSPHTVHAYLDRIYRKLGVSGRCELVLRVFTEYVSLTDRSARRNASESPSPSQAEGNLGKSPKGRGEGRGLKRQRLYPIAQPSPPKGEVPL
jgi:DNA-binding CsgD family transcriptional regulator